MAANKNVLVVGSGGREHALCWKLVSSPQVQKVFVAPGSAGIARMNKIVIVNNLNIKDFKQVTNWCKSNSIDLVAVGPEDPLAAGLADALCAENIKCFGPCKSGARIEADKDWSKAFMLKYDIPTARYQSFTSAEDAKKFIRSAPYKALVVKASGLAAGKGVTVASNHDEACAAVDEMLGNKKFGSAGDTVVIEELLTGEEVSILAFTDGNSIKTMLPAQDHKRLMDNDKGPNTGGMGAYCPCPLISDKDLELVQNKVLQAAVEGLKKEGIKYCGVLYAGMMLTPDGPKTLEFNCRFGDPETQTLMPMLDSDLYNIMEACCNQTLHTIDIKWKTGVNAVGVVMASKGYPETSTKGSVITGLEKVESKANHVVFHSGIASTAEGAGFITNGGRVLIVVVVDKDCKKASQLATESCKEIKFDGAQYRKDIAHKSFVQAGLSYKDSGVDIDAGDRLVQEIKPMAKSTNRPGVLGGLGGFGGLFKLNEVHYIDKNGAKTPYKDPILVQGTDGVGTKLKIAEETGVYDTIGVDLVAMCVNDVLCAGAEPLAFLDYLACGKLDVATTASVVSGIAKACKETGCALLGGETAEMPSLYAPGKHDMAGFCVGVVEHQDMLPRVDLIVPGDVVIGLPSSGVHSNGFSLVHRILAAAGKKYSDVAPFSANGRTFGEELLTPTRLYVSELLPVIRQGGVMVKALAHITGGGLVENIPRVLPDNARVVLDAAAWDVPEIFGWLCQMGNLDDAEMLRTLNCGIGMVVIVSSEFSTKALTMLLNHGGVVIGKVEARTSASSRQVVVNNFRTVIDKIGSAYQSTKKSNTSLSYKSSGVDIEAGELLVTNIKPLCRSTNRPGVIGGLGGFGGLFRVKDAKYFKDGVETAYKDPVLVMGTDGVGTKLKIAQELGLHNTIGIDLVAMCANDILCNGAEPLTFLDYYACGKLDVQVAAKVLDGISEGCRQSGSALIGGETAEMPGMYEEGVYDLAGYSLGIVEHDRMLPRISDIAPGDVLIGLPSAGVHSNGFSLVHRVAQRAGLTMSSPAPFSKCGKSLGEELLTPTKIYVSAVLPALKTGLVKALAHITGGGLIENIPRVLPANMQVVLDANNWNILPVFAWLHVTGKIDEHEMLRTFNCGLGMVLVVPQESEMEILAQMYGHGATKVGLVQKKANDVPQVVVEHFSTSIARVSKFLTLKKKVAVLISGTGSNLQALIDASRDSALGLGAEIVLVISNKPEALGLEKAQRAGIQTLVIKHKDYPSRVEYDMAMNEELKRHGIEIVCLAGFMRILSAEFVRLWKGRLLNVHPSLLPKYKGADGIKQAFESGDQYTGCTVHFVDEGVDTGAILVQEVVRIFQEDTLDTLSMRIHKAEHQAFPRALRMVATAAVSLDAQDNLIWN